MNNFNKETAEAENTGDLRAEDITTGFHTDGYRIDKTASAMNRYTKWEISVDGKWHSPKPVCFHSLPESGWAKAESFDWSKDSCDKNKD